MTGEPDVRLRALLARRYGARVAALRPIAEYGDAEGGVYRVDPRDGPAWVVRLFASDRPLDRVQGDAAVLAYVGRHGVPAERLVPTLDGSGAVALDGRGVLVTRFVAGRRPDRDPTTLRRLGEALGRLHALEAPGNDRWLGRRAGSLPAEDLAAGRADLARIAGRVPPARLAEYETLRATLEATDDGESLPSGLTHSDCHLDNAILTPAGHPVLIDWIGSGQGPRLAALGVLLYSCAVRAPGDDPGSPWAAFWREHGLPGAPVQPGAGPEPARIRGAVEAVIEGYSRHHGLTPAELERLPDAVRFRPVVIAARELATSLERGTPASSLGWWTRYAEAEAVAAYALQSIARAR